jgi:hypothetical protein
MNVAGRYRKGLILGTAGNLSKGAKAAKLGICRPWEFIDREEVQPCQHFNSPIQSTLPHCLTCWLFPTKPE